MSSGSHVVLINLFEVPAEDDDAFIRGWEGARDFVQTQDGYIGTSLHRSLAPDAPYRFVNIARWASAEAFRAAIGHPDFPGKAAPHPSHPALYEVVRTDESRSVES
jgi:heme-degrading monooxygenase HmoA